MLIIPNFNNDKQTSFYYIHYLDATDNQDPHQLDHDQPIFTLHTANQTGQPFGYFKQYLTNVPSGYQFKDVVYDQQITRDGSNVPKVYVGGTHDVYVELVKSDVDVDADSDSDTDVSDHQPQTVHYHYVVRLMKCSSQSGLKVSNVTRSGDAAVGNQVRIKAADFAPEGYQPSDPKQSVTANVTDQGLMPAIFSFMYMAKPKVKTTKVVIFYRDVKNPDQDLAKHTVNGVVGKPFKVDLKTFVPQDYRIKQVTNTIDTFEDYPQTIVVLMTKQQASKSQEPKQPAKPKTPGNKDQKLDRIGSILMSLGKSLDELGRELKKND